MSYEEDYLNKSFFHAETAPKMVGMDIDGNAIYTGDEVYVIGGEMLLTTNANPQTKKMAKLLGLEIKTL